MVVGNGFMCVGWMDGWTNGGREIRKEERKGEMRNRGMGGGEFKRITYFVSA